MNVTTSSLVYLALLSTSSTITHTHSMCVEECVGACLHANSLGSNKHKDLLLLLSLLRLFSRWMNERNLPPTIYWEEREREREGERERGEREERERESESKNTLSAKKGLRKKKIETWPFFNSCLCFNSHYINF